MVSSTIVSINDVRDKYYPVGAELKLAYPKAFVGCKTYRAIIKRFNVEENNYFYCSGDPKELLRLSNEKSKKANLYIRKSAFAKIALRVGELEKIPSCPNEIVLEESFKFDGKELKIPVYGERVVDRCYFKATDVEKEFGIERMVHDTLKDYSGFERGADYVFLERKLGERSPNFLSNKTQQCYLTYAGLTRVINHSRSSVAKEFKTWADRVLFTHQFGSAGDRVELAKSLLGGLPVKDVMSVFGNAVKTPAAYVMEFTVDSEVRCHYGVCKDFQFVLEKYGSTYSNLKVIKFVAISIGNLSNAKMYLEDTLKNESVCVSRLVISESTLNTLTACFDEVQTRFGLVIELHREVDELHCEVDELHEHIDERESDWAKTLKLFQQYEIKKAASDEQERIKREVADKEREARRAEKDKMLKDFLERFIQFK